MKQFNLSETMRANLSYLRAQNRYNVDSKIRERISSKLFHNFPMANRFDLRMYIENMNES